MKKGFTLIELLAVIVILAILALIVSPIISGVITNAKISAAERSLDGYINSIELASINYQTNNGGTITKNLNELDIEGKNISKVKPLIYSVDNKGKIQKVTAIIDDYYCTYKENGSTRCIIKKLEVVGTLDKDFYSKLSLTRSQINSITFYSDETKINNDPIDLSIEKNNKVLGYKTINDNDSNKYDIYIVADGLISLPVDSSYLFGLVTGDTVAPSVSEIRFNHSIYSSNTTNMSYMFYNCTSLNNIDLSSLDTSNVIDMTSMFWGCSKMNKIDLSSFNTSNVYYMKAMFLGCTITNLDLTSFNTNNLLDISQMFSMCSQLQSVNLSSFNTDKVTNMMQMFSLCSKLTKLDLSNFSTTNVANMSSMFASCSSLTTIDLSNFSTSRVTNMSRMFRNNTNLKTIYVINDFNISSVTNSDNMFYGCTNIEGAIKFDSTKITAQYANTITGYFTKEISK